MWDQDGMWRPQDYSLHNTYYQISSRPTEEQKIQYIDNLFNTILERSHSGANFSDLRAEIVDHYVSELGEDFHVQDGHLFQQKVYDYHKKFGGPYRIKEIADRYSKAKKKLIQRQFFKWFLEYWYVHLAFLPIALMIYKVVPIQVVVSFLIVMVLIVCIYEGLKFYKDRHLRKQIRTGDSSVNFFYQHKLEVFSSLYLVLSLWNINNDIGQNMADHILHLAIPILMYVNAWVYYYHLNNCQKRIAPLLDHYKAQMI